MERACILSSTMWPQFQHVDDTNSRFLIKCFAGTTIDRVACGQIWRSPLHLCIQ